jgi:hypothetical protein
MADPAITVGALHWRVTLADEEQITLPDDPGISVQTINQRVVFAKIVPVATMVWLRGQQTTKNFVTHQIFIRWRHDIDSYTVILRDRVQPDGAVRRDVFRIQRWSEVDGRQRFLMIDAEQRETVIV